MLKNIDVTQELLDYIYNHTKPLHDVQKKILLHNKNLGEQNRMQIAETQAHFLQLIIKINNVKNCLEIGTFTGFSAFSMALALPDDGKLITLDKDIEIAKTAKDFFKLGNLENKIEIIQAGCSTKSGKIRINNDKGVESKIEKSKIGDEIEVISIEDIIKKYNVPSDSILKMDCEGCEDEVISSVEINTIRHFSDIQIEYHNGYKKIKNKLEKCGFEVKVTKPISSNVISNILYNFTNKKVKRKKIGYVGFIFAKKRELLN